jgi:O-antigen ligase
VVKKQTSRKDGHTQVRNKTFRLRNWLPTLELLLAVAAAALWYLRRDLTEGAFRAGLLPLGLLVAMMALAALRTGVRIRPTAFAAPLALLLLTAGVSMAAAYDPNLAWHKGWLLVGALGLYAALAHQPDRLRRYAALSGLGAAAAGLTLYFLLSTDWTDLALEAPALADLGLRISRRLLGALPLDRRLHAVNANVIGGMQALLLPCYVPLLLVPHRAPDASPLRRWRIPLTVLGALGAALTLAGLILTVSRGAWVAVAAVGSLWIVGRALGALWRRNRRLGIAAVAILSAVGLVAVAAAARRAPALDALPLIGDRVWLVRTGLPLARAVPFTGIGLGTFMMQYSTYSLLIHVGFVPHSHNMLLDLAIEQGIAGALAYVALVLTGAIWGLRALREASGTQAVVLRAALAALGVGVLHGVVDDVLYGTHALLLLLVPFGLLVSAARAPRPPEARSRAAPDAAALGGTLTLAVLLIGLLVLGLIAGPNGIRAAWHANRGAVAQARLVLGAYDPERRRPSLGTLRRELDLRPALAHFRRALAHDPTNPTARQRMAMIALDRRQFDAALVGMETLWQAGHRDRVTRLLYGDALVAAGRVDEAVPIIEGLPFAHARLLGQAWTYHLAGDPDRETYAREAAARVPARTP